PRPVEKNQCLCVIDTGSSFRAENHDGFSNSRLSCREAFSLKKPRWSLSWQGSSIFLDTKP
ncbi:hypothetical protein, partial [Akkermansia sp.]|uniref:hypothetical protein n=1 Tax=Akkermansia sp. TaxID=1872421 RepID=UPI003AB43F6B